MARRPRRRREEGSLIRDDLRSRTAPLRSRRRARPSSAFAISVGLLALSFAATAAPSPLYGTLQQSWGFTSTALTWAFSVYAIAILVTLLTVGRLGDFVGRRWMIGTGMLVHLASALTFALAGSVEAVTWARAGQGVAMGLMLGALGAVILDSAPGLGRVGAIANAFGAQAGSAMGAAFAGWMVAWAWHPHASTFLVFAGLFAIGGVLALFLPDVAGRPGALRSLIPRIAVPVTARGEFLAAVPVFAAGWMLAAVTMSIAPGIVRTAHGIEGAGGWFVGGFCITAGVGAVGAGFVAPRRAAACGAALMAVGCGGTAWATSTGTLVPFIIAAGIGAAGFGISNAAAMQLVTPRATSAQKASLMAAIYTVSYLAFGVPIIVAGVAADAAHSVTASFLGYVGATSAIAVIAAVWQAARAGRMARSGVIQTID